MGILTKNRQSSNNAKNLAKAVAVVFCAVLLVSSSAVQVLADKYDDQISQLKAQVDNFQRQQADLHSQTVTLQSTIDGLVAQQNALQAEINLNEVKIAQLKDDIAANQAKLEKQQGVLSSTLATLYVSSSTTPVEMLASSKTIGDYVDQQQYNNNIREGIKSSIKKIREIRQALEDQQKAATLELADQQSRNNALAASRNEQANLLASTQGQEAEFQKQIQATNAEVDKVRAEQRAAYAAYARSHGSLMYGAEGNGGYPDVWASAPQDSIVDSWGMYNRECVSYVAWKVSSTGRYVPYWGGVGNAYQWPNNARGIGVETKVGVPKQGAAVVWGSYQGGMSAYGHIAYVELVNGDGSIEVSQYNVIPGRFNRMHVVASDASQLEYIYF
jgi:surface antigen